MLSNEQLNTLRTEYGKIEKIDPCLETYKKICKFLDKMDNAQLKQLSTAKIKWISSLAMNRFARNILDKK